MKIQDMVCTYEQAQKLKELGIPQRSFFFWSDVKNLTNGGYQTGIEHLAPRYGHPPVTTSRTFSAFTSAELGVMLPVFFEVRKVTAGNVLTKETYPDVYLIQSVNEDDRQRSGVSIGPSEAYVKAEMLMFLLESEQETVEQVIKRWEVQHGK